MCTDSRAEDEISEKLFPRVSPRDLYWENNMSKLKRSSVVVRNFALRVLGLFGQRVRDGETLG